MKIENPRYEIDADGYAYVAVDVDGQTARIFEEQKAFRDGFLFLGGDFEDAVPVLALPADRENGRLAPLELHGFTDDSRLLALFASFLQEINSPNFKPRPVVLPSAP